MSNHDGRGQGRFIKGRSINTQLSIFWTCRVSLAPVLSMTKDIFWLLIHIMCLRLDALPPSLFLRAGWSGSRLSSLAKIASTIFVFLKWNDHSWYRTSSHGYWNFDDDLMCWFYWHNRPTLQKNPPLELFQKCVEVSWEWLEAFMREGAAGEEIFRTQNAKSWKEIEGPLW